jgi:PAS domain-containing protein
MIREGLVSETLLNNIIRAAAVFRKDDDKLSIVQINEAYTGLTGIRAGDELKRFEKYLDDEQAEIFKDLLRMADSHPLGGSEGTIRFRKQSGETIELNMRVFLLYSLEDHRIYLSTMG